MLQEMKLKIKSCDNPYLGMDNPGPFWLVFGNTYEELLQKLANQGGSFYLENNQNNGNS